MDRYIDLIKEIEKLKKENMNLIKIGLKQESELYKLEKENKRLRKQIEFYKKDISNLIEGKEEIDII